MKRKRGFVPKGKSGSSAYGDLFKKLLVSLGYGHLYTKLCNEGLLRKYALLGPYVVPVKFDESGHGYTRAKQVVKDVQSFLKKEKLEGLSVPMTVNTFFIAFFYLGSFLRTLDGEEYEELSEKVSTLLDSHSKDAISKVARITFIATVINSDFRKALFTFDFEYGCGPDYIGYLTVVLGKTGPREREFILDGIRRKAYRVGRCSDGNKVKWYSCAYKGQDYPVYIQNHAIHALEKRIDTDQTPVLMFCLCMSIEKNPELRFYNGNYLLTLRISGGKKAGYFVCAFASGCLVLRTFLFITYDGTPEGDLINLKLELDRASKNYMGLSKMSSCEIALDDESLNRFLPLKELLGITAEGERV